MDKLNFAKNELDWNVSTEVVDIPVEQSIYNRLTSTLRISEHLSDDDFIGMVTYFYYSAKIRTSDLNCRNRFHRELFEGLFNFYVGTLVALDPKYGQQYKNLEDRCQKEILAKLDSFPCPIRLIFAILHGVEFKEAPEMPDTIKPLYEATAPFFEKIEEAFRSPDFVKDLMQITSDMVDVINSERDKLLEKSS